MRIALFTTVTLLFACGSSAPPRKDCREPRGVVTYYRDVAPILARNCVGCHMEGGEAQLALGSYAQARPHAAAIKAAVQSYAMPSCPVDTSGTCLPDATAGALTDDEISTIARWADTGALEGGFVELPAVAPIRPPRLQATLDVGEAYTPSADGSDDYRCFLVDPGTVDDEFLSAYQVEAGQPREVHHVVLFGLTGPGAVLQAQILDDAQPGPGYRCFDGPGLNGGFTVLGAWAAGGASTVYPAGTGVRVPGGHKVVMLVHYQLENGAAPDRTTVRLTMTPSVDHEATVFGVSDSDSNSSPHVPAIGADATLHVLGVFSQVAAGARSDSQQFHFEEQSFDVVPGDALKLECGFGTGQSDELCLAGLYVTKN